MYAYDGKICRNSLCLCKTRQLKKNRNDPHPRRRCGADDFDSSCIFFPFGKENEGVVPAEPGTSNSPLDCCIEMGSSPRSLLIKRAPQRGALFIGADDRTRTCTLARWNLNPMSLPIPPHPHMQLQIMNYKFIIINCFLSPSLRSAPGCLSPGGP